MASSATANCRPLSAPYVCQRSCGLTKRRAEAAMLRRQAISDRSPPRDSALLSMDSASSHSRSASEGLPKAGIIRQ
ncbi:hypothetical protein JFY66_05025 [Porphyromonas gingivalis]|nr:hypothetical protein [Porphyromonas gingivalis]MCE8180603.1 hypothetical protein [Porphyromonas gingivalis]